MENEFKINSENIGYLNKSFMRDFLIDRKVEEILTRRNGVETQRQWRRQNFNWADVVDVFNVISQYCGWNSNMFWPEDELLYVLRSYSSSLDGVNALMKLEDVYKVKIPEFNSESADLLMLVSALLRRGTVS